MPQTPSIPSDTRRVILFHPPSSEFFLVSRPEGFSLPEVPVPGRQRVSANLNAAVKRLWNADVVSMGEVAPARIDDSAPSRKYEIVEILEANRLPLPGLQAKHMSELARTSFSELEDLSVLERTTAHDGSLPLCGKEGPFSRFGWFTELKNWVNQELQDFGLRLSGPFTQLNAGASFSLIRFETNRGAVWFKAVGEPNVRECAITLELAARLPQYLPTILASRPEWHAWLSLEAEGEGLSESADVTKWPRAAASLAELQICSIPQVSRILAAGARDTRIPALCAQSDRLFEILEHLMRKQAKNPPAPLTSDELRSLRKNVREILVRLEDLDLPDALGHLDLNPGNVVVSPAACTFLDWAEAAVGPPFFTLQYFVEHFRLSQPKESHAETRFVTAYVQRWESIAGKAKVHNVMRLLPAATVFAYTALVIAGRDMDFIEQSPTASCLRSLARRLQREVVGWHQATAAA
jgi:hypothetical protein